jgi:hypothetical protein
MQISQPKTEARCGRPVARRDITVNLAAVDPFAGKVVMRLKEAFAVIGCGPTKGYDLIKDGRLRVTKIDHMTLAYVSSIRELLGFPASNNDREI